MRETKEFIFFFGKNDIYSNWHKCLFLENEMKFNCTEQYFMYHKAITFNDINTAQKILASESQAEQKKLGRMVKNFNTKQWNEKRQEIMYRANYLKFSQNEKLKEQLLASGDKVLAEASPYDLTWGIGLAANSTAAENTDLWRGQNLLGKILMLIRQDLKLNNVNKINKKTI